MENRHPLSEVVLKTMENMDVFLEPTRMYLRRFLKQLAAAGAGLEATRQLYS
jgi:hypothetical protein